MDPDRMASIEARTQRLEDIEEIRRLRMRYHYFINEQKWDQFTTIFTEDALVDFGFVSQARGSEEIRELFLRIPRNLPLVKQFIHNHMVDVDGDQATGLSYLDARYAQDGESVMVAAKFEEKYRRTPAGWKISEMVLELYFSAPLSKGWAGEQVNFVKPFT